MFLMCMDHNISDEYGPRADMKKATPSTLQREEGNGRIGFTATGSIGSEKFRFEKETVPSGCNDSI